MSTMNETLKRAAENLDIQAKKDEDHVIWLKAELVKFEAAAKQARTDAAEIRKSLSE